MSFFLPGRVLFLAHARTASNATRLTLREYGGYRVNGSGIGDHSQLADVLRLCPEYDGEPVACTVRDHWTVFARWWAAIRRTEREWCPDTFAEFIQALPLYQPAVVRPGVLFPHVEHSKFVMHHATLQRDFDAMTDALGLPRRTLQRYNHTLEVPPDPWTPDAVAFVLDTYGAELSALGFPTSPKV